MTTVSRATNPPIEADIVGEPVLQDTPPNGNGASHPNGFALEFVTYNEVAARLDNIKLQELMPQIKADFNKFMRSVKSRSESFAGDYIFPNTQQAPQQVVEELAARGWPNAKIEMPLNRRTTNVLAENRDGFWLKLTVPIPGPQ